MAVPEWIHIPHMDPNGSSKQHQRRQRQALSILVGNRNTQVAKPEKYVQIQLKGQLTSTATLFWPINCINGQLIVLSKCPRDYLGNLLQIS